MIEDADQYEILEQSLRALESDVALVGDDEIYWFREFLDHGEYGLAVEQTVDSLRAVAPTEVRRRVAAGLIGPAKQMELDQGTIETLNQLAVEM